MEVTVLAIACGGNGGQFEVVVGVEVTVAAHEAVVPPLVPTHVHAQGPEPPTVAGVSTPAPQSPAAFTAAALAKLPPLATPHCPLTTMNLFAKHDAVLHPALPTHVHVQGPAHQTVDAAHPRHRFAVGAVKSVCPSEGPQRPLTGIGFAIVAIHCGLFGVPEHNHDFDEAVVTTLIGAPDEHKFVVGADVNVCPFAVPQAPAAGATILAAHCELFGVPEQFHVFEVAVVTTLIAEPTEQRLLVGADANTCPFALPHIPGGVAGSV
jgi:hypothetical protein